MEPVRQTFRRPSMVSMDEPSRAVHVVTGASGGIGRSIAETLLRDAASFINGAVVPVDGGRAAQELDPEER